MARHEVRQRLRAPLPTGRAVEFITPTCKLKRRALELCPDQHLSDPVVASQQMAGNLLRLCVKKIDEREVEYRDLKYSKLDHRLNAKEQSLIEEAIQTIRKPTEPEIDYALDESYMVTEEGSQRWRFPLLVGTDSILSSDFADFQEAQRDVEEAEVALETARDRDEYDDEEVDVESYEKRLEDARERLQEAKDRATWVEVRPNSKKVQRQTVEQVPRELRQYEATLQKEASENLLRNLVAKVGDQSLEFADLKGENLDAWLSSREQNVVTQVIYELGAADEDEVENFMDSIETL